MVLLDPSQHQVFRLEPLGILLPLRSVFEGFIESFLLCFQVVVAHLSPLLHVGLQFAKTSLRAFARVDFLRGLLALNTQLVHPQTEVFAPGLLLGKLRVRSVVGRLEVLDLCRKTLVLKLESFERLDMALKFSRVG